MELFEKKQTEPGLPGETREERELRIQLQQMDERRAALKKYKALRALAEATGESCGTCGRASVVPYMRSGEDSGFRRCSLQRESSRLAMAMSCSFLPSKWIPIASGEKGA